MGRRKPCRIACSIETLSDVVVGVITSFICVMFLAPDASYADPIHDAVVALGPNDSGLIIEEANTSTTYPALFNYLAYNILFVVHGSDLYKLTNFNGNGYRIVAHRDFGTGSDRNLALVNRSTGASVNFFSNGAPVGAVSTLSAPNADITLGCVAGSNTFVWDSNPNSVNPRIFVAKRIFQTTSQYTVLEIYCEDTPFSYSYAGDPIDWRDHGYIVEFIPTQCNDGLDNDFDGKTDANDNSCWRSATDPSSYDKGLNDEARNYPQCQDGIDNDRDGLTDMNDPGCSAPGDNSESSDFVAAPLNLLASDNDAVQVSVTWSPVPSASSYDLYRSESPNDTDPALFVKIASPSSNSFSDTSAVPGRTYRYAVRAQKEAFTSAFSNVDSGIRPNAIREVDCDGDGVSDAQELLDGTLSCDAGSFRLHLKSPASSKYNTYLSQQNYLELTADGSLSVTDVRVTAYSLLGQPLHSTTVTIAAQTEVDLDINALVGQSDTYGVVQLAFVDDLPGSTLKGRMTNYRRDPGRNTYSFAFAKELRNPTRGDTFAGANSYDPQGLGYLVPNWMEVINLDSVDRAFAYTLYNQSGARLFEKTFTLAPLAERDIQAGHEFGEGVYLAMIHPLDGGTKYFAGVSRYSSNGFGGDEANTYNYAFTLEARAGTGATQFALISNEVGGCFTQSNWFEVVNVRAVPVTASLAFRNESGSNVALSSVTLDPHAQFHFNAGALLPAGARGSVKLDSNLPGGLVAQSLVYYHDCSTNRVQTAYVIQARAAGQDIQVGSANSFLGMRNSLRMINAKANEVVAAATVSPFGGGGALGPVQTTISSGGSASVELNGEGSAFGFPSDAYGALQVQTTVPSSVIPFVLRNRLNPDSSGRMDYVVPVLVQ